MKLNLTQEDLQKQLQALNPNETLGPDSSHPKTFKKTASVTTEPLSVTFSRSFKQ